MSFHRLLGAAVAQLFLIFLIISPELITRMTGREITLKVSKAFKDDIIVRSCLNLKFEHLDYDSLKTQTPYTGLYLGQKVFIPLRQEGEVWVPKKGFQTEKPEGEVFVTAQVSCRSSTTKKCLYNITFIFDFENYFAPEWAVKSFSLENKDVKAKLVVNKSGHAALVKLIVNGSPWP
jgi:uncharacterized membrane-anchored protein